MYDESHEIVSEAAGSATNADQGKGCAAEASREKVDDGPV